MKLFYANGACSLASRIAINELELDCKYESIHFKTNQTAGGIDFNTLNPKGSVPALRLPNGEILTEGAIILQYLADNNPQGENFIPKEMGMPRYRVLEKINFIASDFHKSVGALFNPDLSAEVKTSVLKAKA